MGWRTFYLARKSLGTPGTANLGAASPVMRKAGRRQLAGLSWIPIVLWPAIGSCHVGEAMRGRPVWTHHPSPASFPHV